MSGPIGPVWTSLEQPNFPPPSTPSYKVTREAILTEDEVRQRDTYSGWHFGPKPYRQTPVNWLESLIGLPLAESERKHKPKPQVKPRQREEEPCQQSHLWTEPKKEAGVREIKSICPNGQNRAGLMARAGGVPVEPDTRTTSSTPQPPASTAIQNQIATGSPGHALFFWNPYRHRIQTETVHVLWDL